MINEGTLQAPEAVDLVWMQHALNLARKAAEVGEVPVAAVLVVDGRVIGKGYNGKEQTTDPTSHAEIVAIREAATVFNDWRLESSTLYCTLEPCLMCAGAIIQSRVSRVVYAATDPKFGAIESMLKSFDYPWNHRPAITGGVLASDSAALLQQFFRARRNANASEGAA